MAPHVSRRVVVRVDLEAFFPSILRRRARAVFTALGYPEGVARSLAGLCTHHPPRDVLIGAPEPAPAALWFPHLPQGAPTSPALANVCAFGLDSRLQALAGSLGATYTCYADDLVFSGDEDFAWRARSMLPHVGAIALDEGFALNWRKTRIMNRSTRQEALGIVVNEHLSVRRTTWERLEAILVNCARSGPAAQNRDGIDDFEAHLRGRIAWMGAVDPRRGEILRERFAKIEWTAPASSDA